MGLYSTNTPGTGGSIKEKREDFAVHEVLEEKALSKITSDAEDTCLISANLKKTEYDTNHAYSGKLQKRTGVQTANDRPMGLKDWHVPVTSQYVCADTRQDGNTSTSQNMMAADFP